MNKRQSPRNALQVAQLRCDAAVTITITGNARSGKSTAAELITRQLALAGLNAIQIEGDDSIYSHPTASIPQGNETKGDDRLFLVIVEEGGMKTVFKAPAKGKQDLPKAA